MTSEKLLKKVYNTLVDEFDCWKSTSIKMNGGVIEITDEENCVSMCQMQAVINVCNAFELVNKKYQAFCTFDEGRFLVYAYVK